MRRLASSLLILIAAVFATGCDSGSEKAPSGVTESVPADSPASPSNNAAPAQQGSGTTN